MAPQPLPDMALDLAMAVIATSDTPLLLLDDGLGVVAASASFCAAFGVMPVGIAGRKLTELGAGEWNVPQLMGLLAATAQGYAAVAGYELAFKRDGQEPRCLLLSAHKLSYGEGSAVRLLLAAQDVTDARLAEKVHVRMVEERAVLLQELHHRVANSLQIIASVLMQSARSTQSVETRGHLKDAHTRVMSVAAVQKHLSTSGVGRVALRPYFTALCQSIGASMIHDPGKITLEVKADDSDTSSETSVSLGLIITELVINSLKHAFPDNRGGKILVEYLANGADWSLSVRDNGCGMAHDPDVSKAGLGTSIVQALARQLQAQIKVSDVNPGTAVTVTHAQIVAADEGAKVIALVQPV